MELPHPLTDTQANAELEFRKRSRNSISKPAMKCEECLEEYRRVHNQDYLHCSGCGIYRFTTDIENSIEPIKVLGRDVEGACPKCDCTLKMGLIHDRWYVCYCQNCRGFLIESGCMQVAVHELRANYQGPDDTPVAIDPGELKDVRDCPACLQRFDTHAYCGAGNVVIDSCQGCRLTWLDHGELATIVRAPGKRPSVDSSPFVSTYTHIPTDGVAECLGGAAKLAIKGALRGMMMS